MNNQQRPAGYEFPPQQGYGAPNSWGQPTQQGSFPQQGGFAPPQPGYGAPNDGGFGSQQPGFGGQQGAFPPQQQPGFGVPNSGGSQQQSRPWGDSAGQPGGFPQQGGLGLNPQQQQKLNQLIQRYEISPVFAAKLRVLQNCEIVLLCDDSGSMNTPLANTSQIRWDELRQLASIVVDISVLFDSNGIDINFLNRRPLMNITDANQLNEVFQQRPAGLTPLVNALRGILRAKGQQPPGKKLLIFIATDGAPTDDNGNVNIQQLEQVLRYERNAQTTFVTFLACTDDNQSVEYLANWDKQMQSVDVIDDYRTEKAEIQRTRGGNFPFSYGDYIVKALVGTIDPTMDVMDERW